MVPMQTNHAFWLAYIVSWQEVLCDGILHVGAQQGIRNGPLTLLLMQGLQANTEVWL